ncbi:MAG: FAD-binding protein [Chloroflexi bacterium]|nr:FAD-binding protein [Chloroflexota bacterium]
MQRLQCDVLVVGGGLAGVWAAARARELASRVILVELARISRSGKSSFSGAGILCPAESDDMDVWHREIVEKGQYLNDQDWVRVMLEEHPKRMRDMEQWGLTFERDRDGRIYRHVGLNHVNTRIASVDSLEMMEMMRRRVEGAGVTLLERVMITGLLTSDGAWPTGGAVVGAVGFNTRTGETFVINSAATVMATGGSGLYWAAGDGIAQAYWAGAELSNMEFCRCFDEMSFERKYTRVHLNTYQRLGMKLINASGERFIDQYLPEMKERAKREDLGLAIVSEGMQGNAPIYMDLRHLDAESMDKLYTLPTTARVVNAMKEEGIDFRKQPVNYSVTSGPIHIAHSGIRTNVFGESSLPGLYAAGEAAGMPAHGTYSVGGVNLAQCCVGGYRSGEFAARFALENGARPIAEAQAEYVVARTMQPVKAKSGRDPQEFFDEMHGYLSPARTSVFRDAESIGDLLKQVRRWKAETRALKVRDYHGLVKANRVRPYLQCTELIFKASLIREETRANNIRIDFPVKDNVNWLQWIVQVSGKGGESRVRKVPVPLYRYPVKPERYEKIPVDLYFRKSPQPI